MDWSQLEYAFTLASTAASATSKMAGTVEAVKKLLPSDKKDNNEAINLISGLARDLAAANMMNVELSEALKKVILQLKREDEFEREKARYELFNTSQGDIVYKLRAENANDEPMHFICPACLKKDRLIVFIQGNGDYKRCQVNSAQHFYQFGDSEWRATRREDYTPY